MYGLEEGEEYKPWLWPVPEDGVFGKPGVRRLDGYEKASGKAVYTRDIYRPGMLYAKMLRSPYAHAEIKSMDTSAAEALPGVKAIIRHDDPENVWPREGTYRDLSNWADYSGQLLGVLVVAESEEICDRALRLIDVVWEEHSFITDPEEALEPGATLLRPDLNPDDNTRIDSVTEYGDIEAGFAEATNTIEFKVNHLEEQPVAGAEALSNVAEWKGEEYLEMWCHTQNPHDRVRDYIPRWYGLGESKAQCHAPYQGGQFGSMNWCSSQPNRFTAFLGGLASKRVKKPVKFIWDESNFYGSEHFHGVDYYKVGFKDDGTITAVSVDPAVYGSPTLSKLHGGTGIHNQYMRRVVPYINRGPDYCYKHGQPAASVVTLVTLHVAAELGMDPTEVALKNDGWHGHDMAWIDENIKGPQGFDATRDSLKECLEIGKAAIDWDNKWHEPGTKILPNGKYHGIGFTWMECWSHNPSRTSTGLVMRDDGTVNVLAPHADGGWNAQTSWGMIVASELGLKWEDLAYRPFDDAGFQGRGGGGSGGYPGGAPSMVRAARKLKKEVLERALALRVGGELVFPDMKIEELDMKDSVIFEKANPENNIPLANVSEGQSYGSLFAWDYPPNISVSSANRAIMARQIYFMEVEVDPDTGKCDVTNMVCVRDNGRTGSPEACHGQQYGGCYMGIGRSNTEQVVYDPQTGVRINENLIFDGVAVMNDCSGPIESYFVETGFGYSAYGAYGIGESTGAIVSSLTPVAIYNAIGKFVDDLPTTPDKVLKALGKV